MTPSGFAPSSFGKPTQRNSLLRRVGLFVKKPYLDWDHTQTQLNPDEEDRLRSQFLARRERNLSGRDSHRDLQQLRSKLSRNRAVAERVAAGGAVPVAERRKAEPPPSSLIALDTALSKPRAMSSTLHQDTEQKTIPMNFDGSIFTLSAHVAPGDGYEVRTLESGDLQSCLEEAAYTFATGDEIGAEAMLLQASEDFKDCRAQIYPYLLDLYRITHQTQPYLAAASLYTQITQIPMGMLDVVREQPRKGVVSEPSRVLSLDEVNRLDTSFLEDRQGGARCEFHFDDVSRVAHDALKPLGLLLDRLASTPHEFACSGLSSLINVLEKQAKELLATQSMELHRARYCAARLAGNLKLFEEAADDFSNAARIPAPVWRAPRCMLLIPIDNAGATGSSLHNHGKLYFALNGTLNKTQLDTELQLHNNLLSHSASIDIDCSALYCLSFDAAALLVDWARAASSVGLTVKLHGLHRLSERLLLSIGADAKWLALSHPYA